MKHHCSPSQSSYSSFSICCGLLLKRRSAQVGLWSDLVRTLLSWCWWRPTANSPVFELQICSTATAMKQKSLPRPWLSLSSRCVEDAATRIRAAVCFLSFHLYLLSPLNMAGQLANNFFTLFLQQPNEKLYLLKVETFSTSKTQQNDQCCSCFHRRQPEEHLAELTTVNAFKCIYKHCLRKHFGDLGI